jgi:hypothetical protein
MFFAYQIIPLVIMADSATELFNCFTIPPKNIKIWFRFFALKTDNLSQKKTAESAT